VKVSFSALLLELELFAIEWLKFFRIKRTGKLEFIFKTFNIKCMSTRHRTPDTQDCPYSIAVQRKNSAIPSNSAGAETPGAIHHNQSNSTQSTERLTIAPFNCDWLAG
jgi:hypothetical protein